MLTENLDIYFDTDILADDVTFESVAIIAVKGDEVSRVSEFTGAIVVQFDLTGKTSDIGSCVVGQKVVVDGVTLEVIDKAGDSAVIILTLERVKS